MFDINTPPKGLYKKSYQVTATNATTVAGSITVPTGRGNAKAVSLTVATTGTDVDLADTVFTLNDNGMSFIETDTLNGWQKEFQREIINIIPIELMEGGTLNYSFVNASAVAHRVSIDLYFYNPTQPKVIKNR